MYLTQPRETFLAYCDYIADRIKKGLTQDAENYGSLIDNVGRVEMDLHPEGGYFVSTKKTVRVQDTNGKWYKVTVEEVGCES